MAKRNYQDSRGESEQYALEPAERSKLLSVCHTSQDLVEIKLLMTTGLRVSEAVHLNYTWIRSDGQLGIPARQRCGCKACEIYGGLWQPKTKAGIRVVPLADSVFPDLKSLLEKHPGGLGPSPNGLDRTRGAIYYRVKRLLKEAGIAKTGGAAQETAFPHALRATAATMYAEIGFNAAELCYVMGWSDLAIAQRYINKAMAAVGAADKVRKAGV